MCRSVTATLAITTEAIQPTAMVFILRCRSVTPETLTTITTDTTQAGVIKRAAIPIKVGAITIAINMVTANISTEVKINTTAEAQQRGLPRTHLSDQVAIKASSRVFSTN